MSNPTVLVRKLWNRRPILRDDGLSCGDDVEQLTSVLFLKLTDGFLSGQEFSSWRFSAVGRAGSGSAPGPRAARGG